jgi:hypothetical protein
MNVLPVIQVYTVRFECPETDSECPKVSEYGQF